MNHSDEIVSSHRTTWELIPWVVNGRASAEERRIVEQHLAECGDCRDELAFQTRLSSAIGAETQPVADPEPALQRLWQRIDGVEVEAPPRRRVAGLPLARGLLMAVVVEAVGIALLGGALWNRTAPQGGGPYVTYSEKAPVVPGATIHAVLAPDLKLSELQSLLQQSGLQIVGGPGDSGVYSLAPLSASAVASAATTQAQLERLRANPAVRLAEPIETAPRRGS
ncbi:MAG: zf-HC2 domain-containing protein [Nevskia sp.]|nr:zf-HC2 domain-containing protein [Nevskia sp.]